MKNIKDIVDLVHYFSGDKGYIDESVEIFNEFVSEKVPELKNLLLNTPINKYLYRDIIRYFQSMVYTIAEYKDEAVIFEVSNEFQKHVLDTFRKYDKNNSDAFLLNLLKITGEKSYDMVMSDIKLNLKEIN